MQLIVITPDNEVHEEIGMVNGLFAHGLQRLHLRKPSFTTDDYRGYISDIAAGYHSRIVVHGGFELVHEFGLGGIHINSVARDDKAVWKRVAGLPQSQISTSFHSWQEIKDNEFKYGYVFISPVFDSISKKGYKAGIDLAGAIKTKKELAKKNRYCPAIIGLGGVGGQQIGLLHERGFDGAAMLGAIWESSDPVGAFAEIRSITTSL